MWRGKWPQQAELPKTRQLNTKYQQVPFPNEKKHPMFDHKASEVTHYTGSTYGKCMSCIVLLGFVRHVTTLLSYLPHSLGGDKANEEVPLCLSLVVHLMALSSLWKWKLLMYVTDNGPRGEIGNGSSLMARTEGMNRAGIIERPWVACQVILRGWLDECVAVHGG